MVIFTAGDSGVTVIKCVTLGTLGTAAPDAPTAAVTVSFSGGDEIPVIAGIGYGTAAGYTIPCWVVLPPGSTVKLYGDGANVWTASVDGAVLVY